MTAASSRTRWARVGRTAAGRHGVGGGDCGQATDQIQPQPRPRRRPRATAGGQNEPSARQLWTARATLDRHHRPRIRGQGQDPSGTATARPWLRRNPPRAGTSREEPPRGAKTSRRRGSSGRRARLSTGTTARGSVDKAKIRREPRRRGRGSAATHLEPAPRGRHLRAPTGADTGRAAREAERDVRPGCAPPIAGKIACTPTSYRHFDRPAPPTAKRVA